MHIIKAWCENTNEGRRYLEYNGYQPIVRIGNYWLVKKIGVNLRDVKVII